MVLRRRAYVFLLLAAIPCMGQQPLIFDGEDLEGIVAKLKTAKYDPAATSWLKIKDPIYSQMEGRRELFDR